MITALITIGTLAALAWAAVEAWEIFKRKE